MIDVREVQTLTDVELSDLAEILISVVNDGASVGWLTAPSLEEALTYWKSTLRSGNVLLLAYEGDHVVGTAQLELAQRANGRHRAEVSKVLVHPAHQGNGIGRILMTEVELTAQRYGRTLLHLDTNEDDTTNAFYQRLSWIRAGTIPQWAGSGPNNELHGTTFYYKLLD